MCGGFDCWWVSGSPRWRCWSVWGLAWLYSSTPSSLVPSTDQRIALAAAPLPDTSSLARTGRFIQNFSLEIQKIPGLLTTGGFTGYLQSFSGADADELFKAR